MINIFFILFVFFLQAVYYATSGLHKLQNWLGETIFFLIAWIKNFMLE